MTLIDMGAVEAHSHKYILSQKERRDVGAKGFEFYFRQHWIVYAKHRWIEHLFGEIEHPEFCQPAYFRKMHKEVCQFDPEIVEYVKRRFLGDKETGRKHWEFFDFARHRDEIARDGFDYESQIRPVVIEFGHNHWQLYWKDYYWIKDDQLIVVNRM